MSAHDDGDRLAAYVEVWWGAVGELLTLLPQVPDDAWQRPTDLPGWDVHDVVAHVAHLERVMADEADEPLDPAVTIGAPAHVRGPMGVYCETGPISRRDRTPQELVEEVREATDRRHDALLADPPTDGGAAAAFSFGGMGWTWEALLGNRPLDVWMHEQDVRRAAGMPGGTDTPAAAFTVDRLLGGQAFVLGKRVGAPAGTSVRWEVAGHDPVTVAVGDDGRAAPAPQVTAPSTTLRADRETFALLAGGRRVEEAASAVEVDGDADLARRHLAAMATVP